MTILENAIEIDANPEKIWSVLASLETLDRYDPGVRKSAIISAVREGPGATRKCELAPGGWFEEKVADWNPHESLSFELVRCTLPVRRLSHSYRLSRTERGTLVRQRMEYELKFGPVGKVLDALVVRKKWDAGIKSFFAGLKKYVETGKNSSGKE